MAENLQIAQDLINVVVVGRDTNLRALFKNAGFAQVEIILDLAPVREIIEIGRCDLLIIEDSASEDLLMPVIANIRAGKVGHNPFLPIIILMSKQDRKLARKFILAGVDDVWVKPLSPGFLNKRMKWLVENDFEYEVASEYMAPKRPIRADTVAGNTLQVPNVVRLKDEGVEDIGELIAASIRTTDKLYRQRGAADLGAKVAHLVDTITDTADPGIAAKLKELETVVGQFNGAVAELSHKKFSRMADVLANHIKVFRADPNEKDLQLLRLLAQAVALSFSASDSENDQAWDIVEQIAAQNK